MSGTPMITLRNLYGVLTKDDYPCVSGNVFKSRNRTGLTQSVFLSEVLLPDWFQGEVGRTLRQTEDKRNRLFTGLCNRTLRPETCLAYGAEIARILTPDLIDRQVRRLADFLTARAYRRPELVFRLMKLAELAAGQEGSAEDAHQFLHQQILQAEQEGMDAPDHQRFTDAWLMTWMLLYALCAEGFPQLIRVVQKSPEIYELSTMLHLPLSAVQRTTVRWLGSLRSLSGESGLAPQHYFGHAGDLFDLKDAILARKKILLTGIGGIGKTEMLRQLLRMCVSDAVVPTVCLVQYAGSMLFSFQRSFSDRITEDPDSGMDDLLFSLDDQLSGGLLVIDNLDTPAPGDIPWFERLSAMNCAVFISSRMPSLPGFQSFPVLPPTPDECLLIYRDRIGRMISPEERELFLSLMEKDQLRHPQTIYLLSGLVRGGRSSLTEISSGLLSDLPLSAAGASGITESFAAMYRRLYSMHALNATEQHLAEVFTLLLPGSYRLDWLTQRFSQKGADLSAAAESLVRAGFLQKSGNQYAMHPLVAQSLSRRKYTAARLKKLLNTLAETVLERSREVFLLGPPTGDHALQFSLDFLTDCQTLVAAGDIILDCITEGRLLLALAGGMVQVDIPAELYLHLYGRLEARLRASGMDPNRVEQVLLILAGHFDQDNPARVLTFYSRWLRDLSASGKQPDDIDIFFLLGCGQTLHRPEHVSTGIEMVQKGLSCAATEELRIVGLTGLVDLLTNSGSLTEALETASELFPLLEKCDRFRTRQGFQSMYALSHLYSITRRENELELTLKHLHEALDAMTDFLPWRYRMECELASAEAVHHIQQGKPEHAIEDLRKHMEMARRLSGSRFVCVMDEGTIALTYMQMGQLEKSREAYEQALKDVPPDMPSGSHSLLLNNYAVLCIRMEQPEQAIDLLKQALEIVADQPAAQAEPYRNLGRALDLLGETERALEAWRRALPLLTANYGPDHPRVHEAEERVAGNQA